MECDVCTRRFNAEGRRPKFLPCGHTFCLQCLKHEKIANKCPMDRQEFTGRVSNLPDNFKLLSLIENPEALNERLASASRWWCRDCGRAALDACIENGHRLWSVRKERLQQVQPHLDQLQRGEEAGAALRPQLGSLLRGMEAVRCGLQLLLSSQSVVMARDLASMRGSREEVARELDDAAGDLSPAADWQRVSEAAEKYAEYAPRLQELRWLLTTASDQDSAAAGGAALGEAGGEAKECTITLRDAQGSASATLPLRLPDAEGEITMDSPLLLPYLLLVLHTEGKLKVDLKTSQPPPPEPPQQQAQGAAGGDREAATLASVPDSSPGAELDLKRTSMSAPGMNAEEKAALFALGRLRTARRVTGLHCAADPRWSLQVLRAATNVQELELLDVQVPHLQQLRSLLPHLRRLRVENPLASPCDRAKSFHVRQCRLESLHVNLRNKSVVESLLRAAAAGGSLVELSLCVGVPYRGHCWPYSCDDLDAMLARCGVTTATPGLQRVELHREGQHHSEVACRVQLRALAAVMPDQTVIACSRCSSRPGNGAAAAAAATTATTTTPPGSARSINFLDHL